MEKNKGFTLVEVLVTIMLIGIVAVAIFPVFSNIFSSIFSAGDKTNATYTSKKKIIESIKNDDNIVTNDLKIVINTSDDQYEITDNGVLQQVSTEYSKPNADIKENVLMNYYTISP